MKKTITRALTPGTVQSGTEKMKTCFTSAFAKVAWQHSDD